MILLDAAVPRLVCMQVLDLTVEANDAMLDALVAYTDRDLRRRQGFEGACWLARSAGATPGHANARLLEYTQWSTRGDLAAFLTAAPPLPPEVVEAIEQRSVETYRLDAVITGTDEGQMVLATGDPRVTMVVMMDPAPGHQTKVNAFNQSDTRDFFATYDGFVGTAFHLADGSEAVVEYIQWESVAAFQTAAADPRFGAHLETLSRLCESEVGTYGVARTVRAAR